MTPSQEAKAYAAEHGYTLTSNYSIRRIIVSHGDREVGRYAKYEGCINAMRADRSAMGVVESALFDVESHINKFAADVGKAITDAFAVPASLLSSGSPPMPVFPSRIKHLTSDMRPRWRLWWKCVNPHHNGWRDFHNYADCVKQLRRVFNSKDSVIIKGTKYFITRAP